MPRKAILVAACLAASLVTAAPVCAEPPAGRVAILISGSIRPYLEAAGGASETLEQSPNLDVSTYLLDKYPENELPALSRQLSQENFDLVIAVGPRAARFAWSPGAGVEGRRLYSMVLNPDRVVGTAERTCGISLNIPVEEQLRTIRVGLPGVRRLGLLFDPSSNGEFLAEAEKASGPIGLSLVPLKVSAKPEIPQVLAAHWERIDALWFIPDRTVISESIVEYVIRESIYNRIPVIGYNRFFYDSGASLAFVIDYRDIGVQSAREAMRLMEGGGCREVGPEFQLWVNTRVMGRLGVSGPKSFAGYLREGP